MKPLTHSKDNTYPLGYHIIEYADMTKEKFACLTAETLFPEATFISEDVP